MAYKRDIALGVLEDHFKGCRGTTGHYMALATAFWMISRSDLALFNS